MNHTPAELAGKQAKHASPDLAATTIYLRNRALSEIIKSLRLKEQDILQANQQDLVHAKQENLQTPLLKRLTFGSEKLQEVIEGLEALASLEDPIGKILQKTELANQLILDKVTCPLGVLAMIFESRPDALVQIAGLALKSGNSVVLKGGREAKHTNRSLYAAIVEGTEKAGIPSGWIQLLETREDVQDLLGLHQYIDLIIPRGSNEFVQYIMNNTQIPVMGHADGICHMYVDADCPIDLAIPIIVDGKTQYPAVCNALETLLIHKSVAPNLLPELNSALEEKQVELRGCDKTQSIISCKPATEDDWKTEYLDLILSIKVVESLDEAITFINTHGSGHTDAILGTSEQSAKAFFARVDSSSVLWNCSTRFADGFRYGLGAEVGISTGKLHARGPVGLEGLVTYKWQLRGQGHLVGDFSGSNPRYTYTHRTLTSTHGIDTQKD
jgi:glutamate-5-semialdehyde dehydrogenase